MRLKESSRTQNWKDRTNGRFEIRTGKQIKPVPSDCQRALECLSSCHQALAELCKRHCFHTTWAAHLRVHEACRIRAGGIVIIWWRTLVKCPISGVWDQEFVDENGQSLLVVCETPNSMPCVLTHCPGVDMPLRGFNGCTSLLPFCHFAHWCLHT